MKEYIAAGFDPARFWEITPRLYALEMEGAALRRHRQAEDDRARAWMGAWLGRVEKFPAYDRFVPHRPPVPKRQSPEILQAMFSALAVTWGAEKVIN